MRAEIQDYLNGMSWAELQSKYKCNSKKIYKLLEENNVPRRKPLNKNRWSEEKLSLLKDMYLRNCTYQEMYDALDCKGGTLTYWVKYLGLPMRGSGRNNILENPFIENNSDRDYWLGYLFADGHIGQNNIGLFSKEKYVIDEFNKFCKGQCKVYSRNYSTKDGSIKTMYSATLISKDLQRWFSDTYNIEGDKRYTLNPTIDINWDILRGYFDGDGNAHKDGGWTITSGSREWVDRVHKFLSENDIYSSINEYKNCYKLSVWRKEELNKLIPQLYNTKTFYLKYKFDRLEPYMSNHIVKIG